MKKNKYSRTKKLHEKAAHYNWDNGLKTLYDIIEDKDCDKGTALMIYWMGRPEWDLQFANRDEVDDFRLEEYEFLAELLKRYNENLYRFETIAFDPKNDKGYDWTNQYPELKDKFKRPIPAIMYEPIVPMD